MKPLPFAKGSALVRHWRTPAIFHAALASLFAAVSSVAQIGTVDPTFNKGSGPNDRVTAMAIQGDGRIVIAGSFSSVDGTNRNQVARFNEEGSFNSSFNLAVNNTVNALAIQADGKLLLAGSFTSVRGTNRFRLARINPDGTLDESFLPPPLGVSDVVFAMAVQPDGRILVGGQFGSVNGVTRQRIARLNDDGTLDSTFDPGAGPDNTVDGIVVQPDGGIVIIGRFGNVSGRARNLVARLNPNGSLDPSFDPGAGPQGRSNGSLATSLYELAVQPDGKIVVVGNFSGFNGLDRYGVARLNSDGLVDASFLPGPGPNGPCCDAVFAVALQPDGRLIIGGQFTSYHGFSTPSVRIARLRADGSPDPSFETGNGVIGLNGNTVVTALLVQPNDGRIVIGGSFTNFNGVGRTNLTRIEGISSAPGGEIGFSAASYQVVENTAAATIDVRRSGNTANAVSVGFTTTNGTARAGDYRLVSGVLTFGPGETVKSFTVTNLNDTVVEDTETVFLVLSNNPTGGAALGSQRTAVLKIIDDDRYAFLDPRDFNFAFGGEIHEVVVQPDARIVVAGSFSEIAGDNRRYVARFHPGGEVDTSFDAHVYVDGQSPYSTYIGAMAVQPDGKILIGGNFSSVNGITRYRLARLNAGGSLDDNFNVGSPFNSSIESLAVQSDGSILVGGSFTLSGGLRRYFTRIYSDGSLDPTYGAFTDGTVYVIEILPDRKVLIAGSFVTVNGIYRPGLARLNPDGSLDTTFDTGRGVSGTVFSLAVQPDGKMILGGSFSSVNGLARPNLIRLNADASADPTFNTGAGPDDQVFAVAVQSNGKVLAGGRFTRFNNQTNFFNIIRLLPNGSPDPSFDVGGGVLGQSPTGSPFTSYVSTMKLDALGRTLLGGNFTHFNGINRNLLVRLESHPDAPGGEIEFVSGLYEIVENTPTVRIDVHRIGNTGLPVTIQYYATNGTANAGDYSLSPGTLADPGTLTFAPGVITQSFNVQIFHDNQPEESETVFLVLSNAAGGAEVGCQQTAVLHIVNDDHLRWLDPLDVGIATNAGGLVTATLIQPDGKVIVAGEFNEVGGYNRYRIVRFNLDGSVDLGFKPTAFVEGGLIRAMAIQNDGRIVIGGEFSIINGVNRARIARLRADGSLDPSFDCSANNPVNTVVVQPDGRIFIGGSFSSVRGQTRPGIARLYSDGSIDNTFFLSPNTLNGSVNSIALRPDGRILIAGDFNAVSGVPRVSIARLWSNGMLDDSFDPMAGAPTRLNSAFGLGIFSVALQPDGQIVVGGNFNSFNGISRNGVARLTDDGLLDLTFNPGAGANNVVNSVAVQSDGRILVGGMFTFINNILVNRIARLRADGSIDPGFDMGTTIDGAPVGANNTVNTVTAILDGRILIGGAFTSINGLTRNYLARVQGISNPTGGLIEFASSTYTVAETNSVAAIALRRSGNIGAQVRVSYVATNGTADGGDFISVSNTLIFLPGETTKNFNVVIRNDALLEDIETVNLALSNPQNGAELGSQRAATLRIIDDENSGLLDRVNFGIGGGNVSAGTALPDGRVIVAGNFTEAGGYNRRGLVRYNADGTVDTSFNSHAIAEGGLVRVVTAQTDGGVLLGGDFTSVNGEPRTRLARMNSDGYLDPFFMVRDGGVSSSVQAIVVQPDDNILIAGGFTSVAGAVRPRVARLYPEGSLDTTFFPGAGANDFVWALALQPSGHVLIAGQFTLFNGMSRGYVTRLDAGGNLDPGFLITTNVNDHVYALALQPDGKLVIGGRFTRVWGVSRNGLARLNPDGSLDLNFDIGTGATNQFGQPPQVSALALQGDGAVLVAGNFTGFNGNTNYARLARLTSGGALDPSFTPALGPNNQVTDLWMDNLDRVYVAGDFTGFNNLSRNLLARLRGIELPPVNFVSVTWPSAGQLGFVLRGEVGQRYTLEYSTDLATWFATPTNTVPAATFSVTEPAAQRVGYKFYRTRSVR